MQKSNNEIVRKNKKAITTAKRIKKNKMKINKRRTHSQSPTQSISTQILNFETFTTYVNQLNQKGVAVLPKKEPKVAHLTKMDLNKLFNESKESYTSNSMKKPNYLMKSMFLRESKSPTPHRKSPNSSGNLIYQYFGNSIMNRYKYCFSHFKNPNNNHYYYYENNEEDDANDLNDEFIDEKEEEGLEGQEVDNKETIFNSSDENDFSHFNQLTYNNEGYCMHNRDDLDSNYISQYQNMNNYKYYTNSTFNNLNNYNNQGNNQMNYISNLYSGNFTLSNDDKSSFNFPHNQQHYQTHTILQMPYQNQIRSYNSFTPSINQSKLINQNYNLLSESELRNQMHIIVKYQSGCRYLIRKIEENSSIVDTICFPNVLEHIQELSIDQYGVVFMQKLFKYLSEEKLLQFIAILFPFIIQISENVNGAKLITDFINYLKTDQLLNAFLKIIIPNIIYFINDQYACQIIHKILSIKSNSDIIEMFFEHITIQITELSTNKKGCAFIQKCLGILNEKLLYHLFDSLEMNLSAIITNQYGNYIIQSVLSYKFPSKPKFYNNIINNLIYYSNQKYSSNVVERCFDESEARDQLINEVTREDNFKVMLMDSFGNYVIQRAIITANEEQKTKLFILLVPLIPQLQMLPYGQKLLSKLLIQNPKLAMVMFKLNQ